jgi:PAS domain S-box-containing protein
MMTVIVIGDTIKFQNYRNTLIQNYSSKYINVTQQIREDYRLIFDRLQYDFNKYEPVSISKLNQLYKIYKRDGTHFNVDKAAEELNKDVYFGRYEVFLINKNYIVEDGSYKNDIGLDLGDTMAVRDVINSIFNKTAAINISPIIIDSSSMFFNCYLIKLSNDEKYVLQIALVLDISKELKKKYDSIKSFGLVDLYHCDNLFRKFDFDFKFDKKNDIKKDSQEHWIMTKNFISQLLDDLSIKDNRFEYIEKLDIENNLINVNQLIDKVFTDNKLLSHLNLSQHYFSVYSITDDVFNNSNETKLIIKTTYSTESLESDIQKTFIQTLTQFLFLLGILVAIYQFIIRKLSNPLLEIVNNIQNNRYSDISNIKIKEMAVLNESYNDLHNRLNREIELNKSKERYQQALIDNFPFVIWLKDTESHFLAVNKMLATLYAEDSPANIIGKTDFDYSPEEIAKEYRADDQVVLLSRKQKNLEEEIIDQFGKKTWFETFKAPIFNEHGVALGTVGFSRDITLRKENEEKLKQLLEQERQSRIEQSQFMAMLTHELKTPLAVIRMTLGSKEISPDMLFHSQRAVTDMNNIVERCLQSERLLDAQISVKKVPCSLFTVLNDLCNQPNALNRIIIDAKIHPTINTDEQLLHTLLSNLIDNALKYSSPKSSILFNITTENNGVLIVIQNEIGVASYPDPEKVFQKYYRHKAAHHKTGSGLGLYLVKTISQLLGGDIFYNHDNTNITFKLWLPL